MTNEEAQKREDMLLDLYKLHAYIPNDAEGNPLTPFGNFCAGYEAAISYMQEQSEPTIQVLSIQENKIIPNATFIGVCEHGYSPPAVGTKLYTTPQRQQPLKRLDDKQVELIATNDMFWEANGFSAPKLKWDEFANAIMDAMQEINKCELR